MPCSNRKYQHRKRNVLIKSFHGVLNTHLKPQKHKLHPNSEAVSFKGRIRRLIASQLSNEGCPNSKAPSNASS